MNKLCKAIVDNRFIITAELYPPKGTDIAELMRRADIIGPLVDGVNITDNQRASMRLASIAICHLIKDKGYTPILQMTCRDRNRIALQSDLLSAYVLGIENVLILSGDHPAVGEYKEIKGVYDLDPVQLLTTARTLESGFDLSGKKLKGTPKFCLGAVVNPTSNPLELQLLMMEKKVKAGAQFFQTQTIFDVERYRQFHDQVKHLNVKVLAGVTLLKSREFIGFLKNLPGVSIPEDVVKRVEAAKDPLKEGIKICGETIRELKKFADGVHIMAIGAEDLIPEILKNA
ncbi:MAG: methylenetetrahydrofolate reductase [Endomicrobiales bacterium]|nr:methylenetetrahydrofolate reductase [Endomicrobiales bacterium]